MRALPVLVVALLVTAATVGATGPVPAGQSTDALDPDSPVAQADGGTTVEQINVLDVPSEDVARSSVGEQYVDLGPSLGLTSKATTDRLRTLSMVEHIEAANTTDMRRARLQNSLDDIEDRVDRLDERQTEAIDAHNRGELSSKDLLVTLVRISITAEELNERRMRLEQLADETPGFDINRGRLASIGNRLSAFMGPVRAHARAVLRGEAAPHRFYLATGPGSVTVSTIIGDTYIREAYRGDLRNGAGDPIELEAALNIVAESYPVIWSTTREQTQVFGGGETYPVRIAHSRGDLTAFVDSNARVVYAEHQRRPLDTMVSDGRSEASVAGLRLVVNHTYPGGPVQIRTRDDAGTAVGATVFIATGPDDATRLGSTRDDGTYWTLSPNRRYTVTATAPGADNVSTVVVPGVPPRVGAVTPGEGSTPTPTPTPTPTNETTANATPTATTTASALAADVYQP